MTTHDPNSTNTPPSPPPGPAQNPANTDTPPDLLPTAARIDRLARDDRAAAPFGFEERLFMATRAALKDASAGSDSSAPPRVAEADPVLARIGAPGRQPPWRLAAAVALAATGVMAVWLTQKPGGSPGTSGGPLAVTPPPAPLNVDEVARELEEFLAASDEFASVELAGDELSITMLDAGGAAGTEGAAGDPFWDADVLGVDVNFEESL